MGLADRYEELEGLTPDVVVIGSGYGAGVCAARLAQAGQRVVILERGREWASDGERFPSTQQEISDNTQIDGMAFVPRHRLGLYNFHISRDLDVLVGCGLGGTSLINANVSIQPSAHVFERGMWPRAIREDVAGLAPYFERARAVLGPAPYPSSRQTPNKLAAIEANGGTRCDLNVHWEGEKNSVGVAQKPCGDCGDCITGCNFDAKKTLCFTYLPLAKHAGAKIFVQCDVRYLEQVPGGWKVYYQRLDDGTESVIEPETFIRAKTVIVAAGVLGTTGILMRSQRRGVPISDELGGRVSGNGDAIALAFNCDQRMDSVGLGHSAYHPQPVPPPVGPSIMGFIDHRNTENPDDGIIIEDGAFPSGMARMSAVLTQSIASYNGDETQHGFTHWFHERLAEGRDLIGDIRNGALNRTLITLLMGHDGADGVIELDDAERPTVIWPQVHERDLFTAENDAVRRIAGKLGGMFVSDPLNSELFLNNLITVHPLGGCPMGDDGRNAVVDDRGRVFDDNGKTLAGLYVADGSIIPTSLGVNPLLTITALAERIAEKLVVELTNQPIRIVNSIT